MVCELRLPSTAEQGSPRISFCPRQIKYCFPSFLLSMEAVHVAAHPGCPLLPPARPAASCAPELPVGDRNLLLIRKRQRTIRLQIKRVISARKTCQSTRPSLSLGLEKVPYQALRSVLVAPWLLAASLISAWVGRPAPHPRSSPQCLRHNTQAWSVAWKPSDVVFVISFGN